MRKTNWLDLHMHSNKSNDADFTPEELVQLCANAGLKVVALADHNAIAGVLEARQAAKAYDIEVISGVELDTSLGDLVLHILGYGINVPCEKIDRIEREVHQKELDATDLLMDQVAGLGIHFDRDQVMALSVEGVVTGEMIAEVALKDERNLNNPLIEPYMPEGQRSDNPYVNFYWDYCSAGKAASVPIDFISVKEAVQLIHDCGGVAVLAHPASNIGLDESTLQDIIKCGIDGIEVYSSYHDDTAIKHYEKMAQKYQLLKTIGSDFHGKIKPSIYLGKSVQGPDEQDMYEGLMEAINKHSK